MKPIIVLVATFVVGTAAGTGAKLALTKPPVAVADSLHAGADSTHADSAATAENHAGAEGGDTLHAASQQEAKPVPLPVTPGAKLGIKAPGGAAQAAGPDTATQGAERRVAKVFTSMDAKQAARVLEHMTDGDIHIILGYVGARQAAAILAELPPERVATLSKLAMHNPGAK